MMTPKNKLALHWKILIGLILGIVVGLAINTMWTPDTWNALGVDNPSAYLNGEETTGINEDAGIFAWMTRFIINLNQFVGDLFMRGLRFIAVPIVIFSLIVGASSLNDLSKLSRIGGKTIGIYLFTTAIAISIGLLFANVLKPGTYVSEETRDGFVAQFGEQAQAKIGAAQKPDVWDTVLNIVPKNPFNAIAEGNMLQIVFASLLVGIALTLIKREKAIVVIQFFDAMTDVIIKIVEIVLMIAPYAVFSLIVVQIAALGLDILGSLAVYSLVVVAGLLTMMFVIYPIGFKVLGGISYNRFYKAISPAQLLAFSSASSSATLPVTMECCEQRLGIKEEVSSFVLPIGATINMDGTALYQGVAAVFIAQLYGMDLSIAEQLTIVLTATLASIGTAGVPGVGMIMLVIVLQSVGIPLEGIAVILGVDRILDMCRTSCNITGDCMVCALVASSEGAIESVEEVEAKLAMPMDEDPLDDGRLDE
ncbi:MAG: dicarboxylate/amino acid:cation symporter [Phycisphaerales bacterium]|nr:dicarboxylate/amino acid:cation symporter [Phycisphaerales bacterium]